MEMIRPFYVDRKGTWLHRKRLSYQIRSYSWSFLFFFQGRTYYISFDISKKSAIFKNKFEILLLSVTNTHGIYFVKSHEMFFTYFLFYPS